MKSRSSVEKIAPKKRDRTVVIGVGSDNGFDCLGWKVIAELQRRSPNEPALLSDSVELALNRRLGAPLLEQIEGRRRGIIVDAIESGAAPGTVVRQRVDDCLRAGVEVSSHGFGLAQTLIVGRALGELPDELVIIGLEVPQALDTAPTSDEIRTLTQAVLDELGFAVPAASIGAAIVG